MSSRLTEERGWALVTAIIVMGLLLTIGLATLSWTDTGTKRSGEERVLESTFNLGEAVLEAQIYQLSRGWPSSSVPVYQCPDPLRPERCPAEATLAQTYTSSDYAAGYSWTTEVQDNGGPVQGYYSIALAAGQPGYDANGDGRLWVRAEATVRGWTRRVVVKVRAQEVPLPFPTNVVTAGFFQTSNNGNKVIVDALGDAGQPGDLAIRCNRLTENPCDEFRPGQVSPENIVAAGGDAVSADNLEVLRGLAKRNNTYYASGCPANPTGAVVFVESGNCSYSTGTANTAASPGMLVINNGTLFLSGNFEFHGLVYAHNAQMSTGTVVQLLGTSQVHGAVAVDGPGGVSVGSSALNVKYDTAIFNLLRGYGKAELIPGTWRELRPN